MRDTLGIVSLYSHAWEWTISTNGLMTVRASSAHGTGKKKKLHHSPSCATVTAAIQATLRRGYTGRFCVCWVVLCLLFFVFFVSVLPVKTPAFNYRFTSFANFQ